MSEHQINAYPLSWPLGWKRTDYRIDSRFGTRPGGQRKPTISEGCGIILAQLGAMGIRDFGVIISTNVPLKRDGYPRSDTWPSNGDVGAAVYWRHDDRKRVLACDKYRTVGENLFAIGKTIEATRSIERWGSVTTEQAFAGYVALHEKTGPSCWEILGIAPEAPEQQILDAYRRKAREVHPDNGGSSDAFVEVTKAKDIALSSIRKVA